MCFQDKKQKRIGEVESTSLQNNIEFCSSHDYAFSHNVQLHSIAETTRPKENEYAEFVLFAPLFHFKHFYYKFIQKGGKYQKKILAIC